MSAMVGAAFDTLRKKIREIKPGDILTVSIHPGELDETEVRTFFQETWRHSGSVMINGWSERRKLDENCARSTQMPMLIVSPHAIATQEWEALMAYKNAGRMPATVLLVREDEEALDDLWGPRFKKMATTNTANWPRMRERPIGGWRQAFVMACGNVTPSSKAIDHIETIRSTVMRQKLGFTLSDLTKLAKNAAAAATKGKKHEQFIEPEHILMAWTLPSRSETTVEVSAD